MKTISGPLLVAAVVIAVFTVWITARAKSLEEDLQKRDQEITITGKPAPALSLPALDGHTVSLADYRGKKNVLIAYWASWSSPWRAEMPMLKRLYDGLKNSSQEFEILAVNVDEDRAAAEKFARENNLAYPVLLDPERKTVDSFHVVNVPSVVVVDVSGQIVYGRSGFDQRLGFELPAKLGAAGFRMGGMDGRRGN